MIGAAPVVALVGATALPAGLSTEGKMTAGVAIWMAIWWITEAVPIPVTSLIPILAFPLIGIGSLPEITSPYADPVIFLVLGGIVLGLATERSALHRRIALHTIRISGTRPSQIVVGLTVASALIGAWVSNVATAVIMVPIALSILNLLRELQPDVVDAKFAAATMLGIAYGTSMGSFATLIGQPPIAMMNAFLVSELDYDIGFGQWMLVSVPFSIVMLVAAWLVLTKIAFRTSNEEVPGAADVIRDQLAAIGRASTAERRVAAVFAAAIFGWVVLPLIAGIPLVSEVAPILGSISDPQIAIAAAMACFIVPSGGRDADGRRTALLDWTATREVPWGLLVLFGGGLSLSAAFTSSGLSDWIGGGVSGLVGVPSWLIILVVVVVCLGLTEITSNTAMAAAMLPIMAAVAISVGVDPVLMVMVVTLTICSAYMLPVATPSNAIAFGSGEVTVHQMMRAGLWLNLCSVAAIMVIVYPLSALVIG